MSIIYKILPKICSHVYKVKASKHKKISIHSLIASIILFVIHTYSVAQSYPSHGLWPIRLLCPLSSPGNNTGVGCHFLLQGIFLTQESPGVSSLQVDSLLAESPGKPKNTEVGSLSLFQGIFLTRNQTRVSYTAAELQAQLRGKPYMQSEVK